SRALLAVPAHMGFGVFMGYFYSRARLRKYRRNKRGVKVNLWLGFLSATLLHGFYDLCAMKGTTMATLVFIAFVVVMYQIVYRMVRNEAATDVPV
ncbi:MAG: PrsW family intramembrane metalloprotease, partial [Clostridia bacterium]|nr:PrsW family intramembrane metalloprotease [Clostridia bacterium]